MNFHFSIRYIAPFGQSLHVLLDFMDNAGRQRSTNLLMHTENGKMWSVETNGLVLRDIDVRWLTYRYEVEDDHGQMMRREWGAVPRTYAIDATKNYFFQDAWRDFSLVHYVCPRRRDKKPTPLQDIPVFGKSVIFRVSAPQVGEGLSVAVLGSDPALGKWVATRFLPMVYVGDGDWELSINADAVKLPFEFKYVVVDDKAYCLLEWELGENRKVSTERRMMEGDQIVVYGGNIRCKCVLNFQSEIAHKLYTESHELPNLYL